MHGPADGDHARGARRPTHPGGYARAARAAVGGHVGAHARFKLEGSPASGPPCVRRSAAPDQTRPDHGRRRARRGAGRRGEHPEGAVGPGQLAHSVSATRAPGAKSRRPPPRTAAVERLERWVAVASALERSEVVSPAAPRRAGTRFPERSSWRLAGVPGWLTVEFGAGVPAWLTVESGRVGANRPSRTALANGPSTARQAAGKTRSRSTERRPSPRTRRIEDRPRELDERPAADAAHRRRPSGRRLVGRRRPRITHETRRARHMASEMGAMATRAKCGSASSRSSVEPAEREGAGERDSWSSVVGSVFRKRRGACSFRCRPLLTGQQPTLPLVTVPSARQA